MDIHAEFSGKKGGARIQFGHNKQSQEEKEEWKGHCHRRKEEKGKRRRGPNSIRAQWTKPRRKRRVEGALPRKKRREELTE